jgi:F0F1-type ATP synthase assembly protein I
LSDESSIFFPGQGPVLAFFVEWIEALKTVVDSLPDGGIPAVDDHFIAGTPSESTALKQWSTQLGETLASFHRILDEEEARRSAIESANEARQAANAARRAAGELGALSMGEHFKQIADDEGKSESNWNRILFLLIGLILGMSTFIVYESVYAQWIQTLLHLIIILPIVGAATYASKNAAHHRVVARWARTASVQVNSVEAFAGQLSNQENRDKLILELGKNVFSTPAYGDPSKVEHFSAIPNDIVDALKEVAKRSVPGSAKD